MVVLVALGAVLLAPVFVQTHLPQPLSDPQVLGLYQAGILGVIGVATYLMDRPKKPSLKYKGYHFDEGHQIGFNVPSGVPFVKTVRFLSIRVENTEKLPAAEPELGLRVVDPQRSPTDESPILMSNFALGPVLLTPMQAEAGLDDLSAEVNEMRLAQVIRNQAFVPVQQARGRMTTPFIVGFTIDGGRYFWFVTNLASAPQIPRAFLSALGIRIEAHMRDLGVQFLTKKMLLLEIRSADEVVLKRPEDVFD